MNYKIIATDFDGTLLNSKKEITEKTKKVLSKLKQDGYLIVGVTARNLASIKLACDINIFDYLIINNGTYIYDVNKEKGEYFGYLSKEEAKNITNHFKDICKYIDYCTVEKYFKYKGDASTRPYYAKVGSVDDIKAIIARMNIFFESNEKQKEYKDYIKENFNDIDCFTMQDTDNGNDNKWLVVNPKGVNKFSGLKKLCDDLNIDTEEVIFFGDSGNDVEIIKKVGLGVAMGNAIDKVKEKAKEIALSNDEDGLAIFLEKLIYEKN